MKTGVLQFFSWPNRRVDLTTVYARALERIEVMDQTGYMSDIAIHGTPESVIDQIERLRGEMNLEYLLCAPLSQETFTAFTERVLLRLR